LLVTELSFARQPFIALENSRRPWSGYFEKALGKIAIRRAPLWNQGLLEGLWFVRFDSRKPKGQRLVSPRKAARDRKAFLTALLCELKLREPAIEFQTERDCRDA
ncbi:MAG: hypothetical protein AAB409_02000, partial [Gemmatimonadota bacterium]